MSWSWHDNVIVALDYENPEHAFRLVDSVSSKITCFKIGPLLYTRSGPEVIRYLHEKSKNIFVDLKLHDTPNVVADTVKQLAELGVDFATVHCMGGKQMLEAAGRGCRGSKLKLLGVTLLTSFDPSEALSWGWETTAGESVGRFMEIAQAARLPGIICSVAEAKELRPMAKPGFLLVTPGIRLPNREVFQDDQKRVATPRQALEAGADWLIIGRPITQARDPKAVVDQLFD